MSAPSPIIGRVLSRYRILEEVGRGGMAVVYRGFDEALSREVAVKVLHTHLASDEESKQRLQREAQAVAKLRHDNILEIFDYAGSPGASSETESFIVTEFIRGQTLTAFLAKSRLPVPELAELIVAEVAGALEHAHRYGVIHRDVKPENVMIRDDGRIKLTDFGIAQIIDKERLTATGQLIGSPAYLAPELVEGGRVDFRTDVFAVGIVLYRLATGQLPFQGRNPHEVMKKIVDGRFAPPDQLNPLVGTQLGRIIARTLAHDPDARYPDMGSLRGDLLSDAAAAGLDDPRREISAFFADPASWEQQARPRMGKALVASAKREAQRGRTAAAVGLAGRALALDPKDVSARAVLDGIGRRKRAVRTAAAAAGIAAVVAGGAWVTRRSATPTTGSGSAAMEKAPRATSGEEDRGVLAGAATDAHRGTGRSPEPTDGVRVAGLIPAVATTTEAPRKAANPIRAELRPRPQLRPPPNDSAKAALAVGPPRAVTVNVLPTKNVQISIDGKPAGSWEPGAPLMLPPGEHVVEFTSEFCNRQTRKVGADVRALGEVRLEWKQATLAVTTTPPGVEVLLTTSARRTALKSPFFLPIPIAANSTTGRERIHLTASADGFRTTDLDVEVVAGRKTEVKNVVLTPAK